MAESVPGNVRGKPAVAAARPLGGGRSAGLMNPRGEDGVRESLRRAFLAMIVTVAVTGLAGCGRPRSWKYSIVPQDAIATIDMEGVKLVFEGVPCEPAPGVTFGEASGTVRVGGGGQHFGTMSIAGRTFTHSYADGVTTMTFEGYGLWLREGGGILEVGTREFDLSGGKRTIVIAKDGTARVKRE